MPKKKSITKQRLSAKPYSFCLVLKTGFRGPRNNNQTRPINKISVLRQKKIFELLYGLFKTSKDSTILDRT